jgi:hypothetical protein
MAYDRPNGIKDLNYNGWITFCDLKEFFSLGAVV